ncbi:MAG TPA: zinc-ribbon domain-containing protein [Candidatus Binataceae bacterium]|nr:zinc-ribbon domain-containing protein [Candidatus Binataceae bacterium]
MIEIQCTSCQTRYRIDERILPEDTPTFKCSRCGHVFSAEPRQKPPPRASAEGARAAAAVKPVSRPAAAAAAAPTPPADKPPRPTQQQQEEPPPAAHAAAAAPPPAAEPAPGSKPRQAGVGGRRAASTPPPAARAAEPAPAAEPQAQGEKPSPARSDTDELLQRRFRDIPDHEADKPGENLAFDFNDEPQTIDPSSPGPAENKFAEGEYAEDKWEVGDTNVPPLPPVRPKHRIRISDIDDDLGDPSFEQTLRRDADQDFERIRPDEVSAQAHTLEVDLRSRSYKLHSAGYFIGLFAMVIFGFGIVTVVIQSAPVAIAGLLSALPMVGEGLEPPISAAQRVALGQVQAQYAKLKGNQTALVISGSVENLTPAALGAVRIEAALTASSPEPLRSQAVYCGNSLSSKMIGEMTSHEIEFFEKLDAPKSFTLAPQASAPFVIVFVDPPAGADHFQLRVVSADPAAAPPPTTEGG